MTTFDRKYPKIVLVDNLIVLKKRQKKIVNFGSVFRPLYHLSRVWGLAPFSIATDSKEEIKIAKIHLYDVVRFLTAMIIYGLFTYDAMKEFEVFRKKSNQKAWIACARLVNILGFSYGILVIIMNVCNRHNLSNFVNMYIRFDKEVLMWQIGISNILMLISHLLISKDGKI